MLYVFHVDAGLMTTYDMNLTLESVTNLKAAIERKTKIPASSLVLLVSGGEVLQGDHMVSSYSAGTDTNPIYMFSKPNVKETSQQSSNQYSVCDLSPIVELSTEHWRSETRSGVEVKSVGELKAAVEMCCGLPPSVQTVVTCATLAQQFSEHAREFSRSCDQMVHDQHLQYQGWSAVVANLEDIFNEFCERSKNFKESFKKHRLKKDSYHEQLNALNDVLESLGKIPILPALRLNAEAHRFSAFDVFEEADFETHYDRLSGRLDNSSENKGYQDFGVEAFKMSEEDVFNASKPDVEGPEKTVEDSDEGCSFKARSYDSNKDDPTLLHWILAQGNKASLQDILDYCQKGLSLIDADLLKEREAELCHILEYANMHGLKQIKGIEDRLYGLDQLSNEVKRIERDQHDQAASLIQNRERVSSSCDPSVLPTLVQSHRYQLDKLLKNHQQLVDIRKRISKSKDELSRILKARLEAVLTIENSMSVQDAHQMLSFQCFARLARYFDIVEQLHRAPAVFVRAVHEVARRRVFSEAFLEWSTALATRLLDIHNEEVYRRQEFNTLFHGHFLKSLFPGMAELPPPFATQTPSVFDGRVPKLTSEDVQFVTESFPDLAEVLPNYDMDNIVKFFKQRIDIADYEDKDIDVQEDLDKVFDSATETGDFERLSRQSTSEKQKVDISIICVPETMAVSTLTEDNMDIHKQNMDKLKGFLQQLYELCKANIMFIKEELSRFKNEIDEQKKFVVSQSADLLQALQKCNEQMSIKFREDTQRLTVDHELELADIKNELKTKEDLIEDLTIQRERLKQEHMREKERLENDIKSTKEAKEEVIKSLEIKLEDVEAQKQKELKDMQDKMHQDYKAEIESMRSRFRLVALTNMDRSPSESSLEKIERTDVIEISSHNAIVMQTKENAELEKEEAIKKAIEEVTAEWQQKLADEVAGMKTSYEKEKQVTITDVTRRLLAEKDRQLELLQQREQILVKDCYKYKATIEQLTDPETNEGLQPQLQTLENEKILLQTQLESSQQKEKELTELCNSYKTMIDTQNLSRPEVHVLEAENKALQSQRMKLLKELEMLRGTDSSARSSSPMRGEGRRGRARCHTPCGLSAGTLSLSACLPGHTVLVLWDPAHHNYTVMQEAPVMYFVHSECLAALDLSIVVKNEAERRLYAIATVDSKEFCYAKKTGNRYNMPRTSRFYRVRVKPYRWVTSVPQCCDHKHRNLDCVKGVSLAALGQRSLKKLFSYMHAPGHAQKSIDTSQSTSSATDEGKISEVVTATLINLESPVSAPSTSEVDGPLPEEQHDSIEASDWGGRGNAPPVGAEMDCSVGRVLGAEMDLPTELIVSSVSVESRTDDTNIPADSELAEEATP